jgi:hypothetical protein
MEETTTQQQKDGRKKSPIAPRGCSNRSNYRSAHDEETAYDSYMNPEPGFRAGPGDSYDAA